MKKLVGVGVVVILALVLVVSACADDEITEGMDYAREAYEEGSYSEAIEELEIAITQIRSLQTDEVRKALPEPLAGWTAEDQESQAASFGFFGLGSATVGATRRYYEEESDQSIEISIMGESPLLQQLRVVIQNPGLQPGTELVIERIAGKRRKIAEKFSAEDMAGTLSLELEEKQIFITVEGWDISDKEILYEYLLGIDFELVLEVL